MIRHYCTNIIFLIIIPIIFLTNTYAKNLHIVLLHGILSDKHAMIPAEQHIREYLPNTYIKSINLGEGILTSLCNMHDQVKLLKKEIENDEQLKNGCIMIGHSQGGLVARYFIEKYNDPRVYIYIAWGTPEHGIFGSPGTIDNRFAWLQKIEKISHIIAYSFFMQRFISFAGYWKDPFHYEMYLKKCMFLPYINNEIDHCDAQIFKDNICSLNTMVLVQSTIEDVVDPASSCHFGFYPPGSTDYIESLFDSEWYQSDKLGIKTLAESGRLHLKFAHCNHTDFQEDLYNFVENTLPYLKYEIE
jgi:palmitoyl-protein thioesterase